MAAVVIGILGAKSNFAESICFCKRKRSWVGDRKVPVCSCCCLCCPWSANDRPPLGVLVSPLAIRRSASRSRPRRFAARRLGLAPNEVLLLQTYHYVDCGRKVQRTLAIPFSVPWHCPAKTTLGGATYHSTYPGKRRLCLAVGVGGGGVRGWIR